MKQWTLLLAFLFFSVKASALCVSAGLSIWPSGKSIKQNSLFVINGYSSTDQEYIRNLNKKHPIYLRSGDEKIELKLREILIGEDHVAQAILIPQQKLVAGKEYQLFIDNLPSYAPPYHKWNSTTQKYIPAKWLVEEGVDTEKSLWLNKPIEKEKVINISGCGDGRYVNFSFKVSDKSEFLIKTTVKSLKTKKATTFYITPEDGAILMVGHTMCGGPFSLDEGMKFEVSFDIMDASGNVTPWEGKKISFIKPTSEMDFG